MTALDAFNQALFLWINADAPGPLALWLARAAAQWLVCLYPLFLVVAWLRDDGPGRNALLQALGTVVLALVITATIRHLWFHPRPFAIGVGHAHLAHAANASFPSRHLAFIWALCAGLAVHAAHRRAALGLAVLGLVVAWARIDLGVHWPLDMVGAALVALGSAALLWPLRGRPVDALRRQLERPYRWLFRWPIRRGWVRA